MSRIANTSLIAKRNVADLRANRLGYWIQPQAIGSTSGWKTIGAMVTATPAKKPSSRIPSLDGLRALSIGMVLFAHCSGTRFFPSFVFARRELGNLGVRVFFVISGYLITTLLLNEMEETGRISLKWFYIRRALRIFPAAYVYIAVMFLLTAGGWLSLNTGDFLHAITYTVNYQEVRPWYTIHLWSLSVEEQFYFLWPATLLFAGRRRGMQIAASMMVIAPLLRILTPIVFPSLEWSTGASFQTNADALAAGCVLAGIRQWLASKSVYLAFQKSYAFLLVPSVIVLAVAFPSMPGKFPVLNTAIALIVDRSIRFEFDWVGKILNWKPVAFAGVLSYSTYLWQEPFLNRLSNSPLCWFPINIAMLSAAALGSYYLVERPFLNLRKRVERQYAPTARSLKKDTPEALPTSA